MGQTFYIVFYFAWAVLAGMLTFLLFRKKEPLVFAIAFTVISILLFAVAIGFCTPLYSERWFQHGEVVVRLLAVLSIVIWSIWQLCHRKRVKPD